MQRPHSISVLFLALFLILLSPIARADQGSLKIGVITPLSGGMATIGSAVKNGIELARSEQPELFKNISFMYEDDQFDPKQSLTAYKKLRDIDHVSLIFGFGDTLGLVLGPLADQDKILLVNFNFEATPAIGKKLVVRSMNHTRQYMTALANYLNQQGNSKFEILQVESPFFNAMVKSFRDAVGDKGTVEVVGNYTPTDTDFKAIILKLKSKGTAPVGIFLSPNQILDFMKQAKELRLEREYFGTDLFETAAGIVPDPANLQGCLYPDNQVSTSFRTNYRRKFGNEAQLTFAGSAYEMALLVGRIYRAESIKSPVDLMTAFATMQKQTGVLGSYSFVDDKQFGKFFEFPVYVKRIVGSTGVPVK
ncbi:MAG: ABC transporter substrate-binding protein [Deltaproteobacteria bacterium]|nr:ABC transporter substrate-binding protein [Deltaproteobacteria bacterium]